MIALRDVPRPAGRLALCWLTALALTLSLAAPAAAQDGGEAPRLPDPAELEERLEAWRAELSARLQPTDESGEEAPPSDFESGQQAAPPSEAAYGLELLEQQLDSARRAERLAEEADEVAERLAAGPARLLDAQPPFGFEQLDDALDRRVAENQAERLAGEAVDVALGELEAAEDLRRQLALEDDVDAWRARTADARFELAEQRLANARRELETARDRHDLAKDIASYVSSNLQAKAEELEAAIAHLDDERLQVEARRQALERDAELAERRWHEAQARAERSDSAAASAEAAARRASLDLEDTRLRLLDEQLDRLGLEGDTWRHRFSTALEASSVDPPELDLAGIDARLGLMARERELKLSQYRSERRSVDIDGEADGGVLEWRQRHRQTLGDGIDLLEDDLAEIERLRVRIGRVQSESQAAGLRLRQWIESGWGGLERAWRFELLVVDGRPITLGKALLALLLILIGYRVSRQVSRSLGDLLRSRFHMGSGAAAALQNLTLYLLLVFFFLWAFQLVGIPLTVFTVLGGVVAIGVGFGSQNIVNNFISGLILLVERPIKVGDLIEVDGVLGSVERIGLRSTRVRAGDNSHVIVPNSSFLEKNVLNWTVSDDIIRGDVDVGVAYGSPVDEVKRLIEQALSEEPLVIDSRGWDVLFIEFGDNALAFRCYFWIRVAGYLDRVRAASAIRFRIDALFREADITISFPQRDVHLDTLRPLEVRMIGGDASPRGEDE